MTPSLTLVASQRITRFTPSATHASPRRDDSVNEPSIPVTVTTHYPFHAERNARVVTCRFDGRAMYLTCQVAHCPPRQSGV